MKGTLLMLALLVTRELGIEMGETCPIFYEVFGMVALGDKTLLNVSLDLVSATEPEKIAIGKIQDCYNEAGPISKTLDLIVMSTITTSGECISHAVDTLTDFEEGLPQLIPLGR
ncbi:major allergen I polypeptide chain 2-like [Diceros bicornis minor]|uniref:major allergen I polypeptide chain 2-like n=1 Tax=Diceros bicornis minor TaxID=77932 RepID=UPI0026F18236|nr:major allergen I polypeptide chain 2-like [Diceros bicornis minor]